MELIIGKAGSKDFSIDAQELVTGRSCIIAQSGAGKSWTLAVVCEQMCKANIGFVIIDTEGEYFSLKEKFELLWVGSDENCDANIEQVNVKDLMRKAIQKNISVIFDVSETDMRTKVAELADALYEIESELRTPYLMIIEEADKFIPQSKDSIKKIEEISRRGRKRGLGMLVATQRPSLVTKNVLSQCNNQIIGKLSIENDLKAVDLFFGSRQELEELAGLLPGEFFVMGGLVRAKTKIKSGMRETKHKGLTPKLIPKPVGKISELKISLSQTTQIEPTAQVQTEKPEEVKPSATQVAGKAVVPQISKDQALALAEKKRKKKFLAFGTEERITSADLVYHPLVFIEAKYIGGLLLKSPKISSFVIDGVNASLADLKNGFKATPGFSELLGLTSDAVLVLSNLNQKGLTYTEVEAKTKLASNAVRDAMKLLKEKKLATDAGKIKQANLYIPLVKLNFPKLNSLQYQLNLNLENLQGKRRERRIAETDLRTILKGLEPSAEIIKFQVFYYPLYEAKLASDKATRTLQIDAVSGNEIRM